MANILEDTNEKTIKENILNGNYFFYLYFISSKNDINNRGIETSGLYHDGEKWNDSKKIAFSINYLYELLIDYYKQNDKEVFDSVVTLKEGKKYISIKESANGSLVINHNTVENGNSALAYSKYFKKYFLVSKNASNLQFEYHILDYVETDELYKYINSWHERVNRKNVQQ